MKIIFYIPPEHRAWFIERGFTETDVSRLPKARADNYNYDRRSKVFRKEL